MDTVLTKMIKGLRGYKTGGEVKKIMFIFIRIEEIKRGRDQGVQNPKKYWRKNDATRIFKREAVKTGVSGEQLEFWVELVVGHFFKGVALGEEN